MTKIKSTWPNHGTQRLMSYFNAHGVVSIESKEDCGRGGEKTVYVVLPVGYDLSRKDLEVLLQNLDKHLKFEYSTLPLDCIKLKSEYAGAFLYTVKRGLTDKGLLDVVNLALELLEMKKPNGVYTEAEIKRRNDIEAKLNESLMELISYRAALQAARYDRLEELVKI